jgi:hypothetical protein
MNKKVKRLYNTSTMSLVNEAGLQLQAQSVLQNYTIASLASEFGFNLRKPGCFFYKSK